MLEADIFGSPRPSQLRSVLHFDDNGMQCTLPVLLPRWPSMPNKRSHVAIQVCSSSLELTACFSLNEDAIVPSAVLLICI